MKHKNAFSFEIDPIIRMLLAFENQVHCQGHREKSFKHRHVWYQIKRLNETNSYFMFVRQLINFWNDLSAKKHILKSIDSYLYHKGV